MTINCHLGINIINSIDKTNYCHLLTIIIPQVTFSKFTKTFLPQVVALQGGLLSAEHHGHHAGEKRKDPIDTWKDLDTMGIPEKKTRWRFRPTKIWGLKKYLRIQKSQQKKGDLTKKIG